MLLKSELCQIRVSPGDARFDPFISTQEFGAIVWLPLAAFPTELMTGRGGLSEQVDAGRAVEWFAMAKKSRLARAYKSWSDIKPSEGLGIAGHGFERAY